MNRFRYTSALAFAAGMLSVASLYAADKPRKVTPPLAADKYACHDAHANEHVTIAAEPGDTKETEPNTRLDYFHHGFMPMRVIVTNDSDQALTLDDARILFVPAEGPAENAATDDDLQRRLLSSKSVAGTKIPLGPLPSITIHHKPVDKQILADDDDFGFKSTTVAPHTTAAGYIFYDTQNIDDPVLEKATLEIRKVRFASTNKSLDSFVIALKPTAAPKATSAEKR